MEEEIISEERPKKRRRIVGGKNYPQTWGDWTIHPLSRSNIFHIINPVVPVADERPFEALDIKKYSHSKTDSFIQSIELYEYRRPPGLYGEVTCRYIKTVFNKKITKASLTHLKTHYKIQTNIPSLLPQEDVLYFDSPLLLQENNVLYFDIIKPTDIFALLYALNRFSPFSKKMKEDIADYLSDAETREDTIEFINTAFGPRVPTLFDYSKAVVIKHLGCYMEEQVKSLPEDISLSFGLKK